MIEVRVGAVERHPVTGAPLVALEPRDAEIRTRLVLPLSAAVACSLSHELEGHTTLRSTAYTLLGQLAGVFGGEVSAVEILPAPNGMAAGRLCVGGPAGAATVPVEIALGIGVAVTLGVPLRVADELVRDAPPLSAPAERPGSQTPAPAEVPEAFRRAFPA